LGKGSAAGKRTSLTRAALAAGSWLLAPLSVFGHALIINRIAERIHQHRQEIHLYYVAHPAQYGSLSVNGATSWNACGLAKISFETPFWEYRR
jgi:hypothetical protein